MYTMYMYMYMNKKNRKLVIPILFVGMTGVNDVDTPYLYSAEMDRFPAVTKQHNTWQHFQFVTTVIFRETANVAS